MRRQEWIVETVHCVGALLFVNPHRGGTFAEARQALAMVGSEDAHAAHPLFVA
jgi:hypothetical protein